MIVDSKLTLGLTNNRYLKLRPSENSNADFCNSALLKVLKINLLYFKKKQMVKLLEEQKCKTPLENFHMVLTWLSNVVFGLPCYTQCCRLLTWICINRNLLSILIFLFSIPGNSKLREPLAEINIDGKTMEATKQAMKTPTRFTFEVAAGHVYLLLLKKDCYPRFIRSENYKSILGNAINPGNVRRR